MSSDKEHKKIPTWFCGNCQYKGRDFKLKFQTYTFCVAAPATSMTWINPALRYLKEHYEQLNAGQCVVCPRCGVPLRTRNKKQICS